MNLPDKRDVKSKKISDDRIFKKKTRYHHHQTKKNSDQSKKTVNFPRIKIDFPFHFWTKPI